MGSLDIFYLWVLSIYTEQKKKKTLLIYYQTIQSFNHPEEEAFWKHCGKMPVTSIFWVSPMMHPTLLKTQFHNLTCIRIIVCKSFQFGQVQNYHLAELSHILSQLPTCRTLPYMAASKGDVITKIGSLRTFSVNWQLISFHWDPNTRIWRGHSNCLISFCITRLYSDLM